MSPADAFRAYCSLQEHTHQRQFCFYLQTEVQEFERLVRLRMDRKRLCKKLVRLAPDLCIGDADSAGSADSAEISSSTSGIEPRASRMPYKNKISTWARPANETLCFE